MLEIKLNEIGHLIDYFIIVEGRYSLQNKPRVQCFPRISQSNPHIFKWLHKCIYIYDSEPIPVLFRYWEAEVYYRDLIGLQGLQRLPPLAGDDLIIVSDVDEILTDSFLHMLKWYEGFPTLIEVQLLWSYYSFYWINPNLFKKGMVASIKELSILGNNRTNALRLNLFFGGGETTTALASTAMIWRPTEIVGWHCSWCMPTEDFLFKMQNFAHSELNTLDNSRLSFLSQMREHGLWFPDQQPNGCIQSRLQYPHYVYANMDRFHQIASSSSSPSI